MYGHVLLGINVGKSRDNGEAGRASCHRQRYTLTPRIPFSQVRHQLTCRIVAGGKMFPRCTCSYIGTARFKIKTCSDQSCMGAQACQCRRQTARAKSAPQVNLLGSCKQGHLLQDSSGAVWNEVPSSDPKKMAPCSLIHTQLQEFAAAFEQPCDRSAAEVIQLLPYALVS